MSRLLGIIGYPLGHSISPLFQQAALDYCRLDIRYERWETEPSQLEARLKSLRLPDHLGANVTVPFKEKVMGLVDRVEGVAQDIGAVNTIVNQGGRLTGYNTDAAGFLQALTIDGNFSPRGKKALILGAGGAARAIGFALVSSGIGSLLILNRTYGRGEALAEALRAKAPPHSRQEIEALSWNNSRLSQEIGDCLLVVNCTSVGMRHSPEENLSPLEAGLVPQAALVFDLVYNPLETPFLMEARRRGCRVLNGLTMLVYQGAASFELWTGKKAPLPVMLEAARKALSG